ncbi:MAG: hypothetical protein JO239_12395, partial [Paraburkholderia sp.]|nr:hypothetical protein [Paraburkholderia sp.]
MDQHKRPDSPRRETPPHSSAQSSAPSPASSSLSAPVAARRGKGKFIALGVVIVIAGIVLARWQPWNKAVSGGNAATAAGARMRHGGP